MTGLHVRTVQRALGLAGRPTWSTPTVQAIARALRVDLDSIRPQVEQGGAGRSKVEQDGAPVSGWEQAALVLRVSRWTLRRARTRANDQRAPWWPSRDAVLEWYAGLVAGVDGVR